MNEKDLYQKLVDHDEETYQLIIETYSKLLWAIVLSILGNKHSFGAMDVEEIVSDVFIRLWREPEKFDPEKGTLKNYLAMMAKSMALNRYKQLKRRHTVELFDSHDDIALVDNDWGELYHAIQLLDEPYKEIIVRRFFLSEKPRNIRKQMNYSVKQFDNYLYRGKKKLKDILLKRQEMEDTYNEKTFE